MRLYITEDSVSELDNDIYTLTPEQFSQPQYHPFIASNQWDGIDIDITESIPTGLLKQVLPNTIITPHVDFDNFTTKCMLLVCEIYTDDSPKIRSLYQRDKIKCIEFVKSLSAI